MANKVKPEDPDERRWRLDDDLQTLAKAIEIAKDKKRLAEVQAYAKEKKSELEMIEDVEYLKQIGLK